MSGSHRFADGAWTRGQDSGRADGATLERHRTNGGALPAVSRRRDQIAGVANEKFNWRPGLSVELGVTAVSTAKQIGYGGGGCGESAAVPRLSQLPTRRLLSRSSA